MDSVLRIGITAAILLVCLVHFGESGECCRAHYSLVGNVASNDQKWCDNYCCFTLLKYDCCDNIMLQAPDDMRMDFCQAWFNEYWYLPLFVVLAIVSGIVCCCCVCHRNRSQGVVLAPPQQAGMVIVTQQHDQASHHTNPYNTGYNQ